jgi:hypothetical protein
LDEQSEKFMGLGLWNKKDKTCLLSGGGGSGVVPGGDVVIPSFTSSWSSVALASPFALLVQAREAGWGGGRTIPDRVRPILGFTSIVAVVSVNLLLLVDLIGVTVDEHINHDVPLALQRRQSINNDIEVRHAYNHESTVKQYQ